MIFTLALKNIFRNKKNSLVIIILVALMTFLFFLGNTIIAQSGRGLRAVYTESLTGDIVIEKKAEVTMSLFGANAPHLEDFFLIEPLPAYNSIVDIIKTHGEVENWTAQVSTGASMKVHGKGSGVYLVGVDAQNYFDIFPGIQIERGRFLSTGEAGVMINSELAAELETSAGESLIIGEDVTLTTTGILGFKIRTAPLIGIFRYANESTALSQNIISDAETARALAAIRLATANVQVSEQTKKITSNFDSLYSESNDYIDVQTSQSLQDIIDSYLDDNGENAADNEAPPVDKDAGSKVSSASGGDWNFIIIKLKPGFSAAKTITALNKELEELDALAIGWRTAAGISAILVLVLQALYNAGIVLVCVAGCIAAVNILLIAVFKRTREIGTLRAIGAGTGYIRLMLINENIFLGISGGLLGIGNGTLAMALINRLELHIGNKLIVNLLGLRVLHIVFFSEYALGALGFALALVLVSLIVPLEMAVRITPAVAVREG